MRNAIAAACFVKLTGSAQAGSHLQGLRSPEADVGMVEGDLLICCGPQPRAGRRRRGKQGECRDEHLGTEAGCHACRSSAVTVQPPAAACCPLAVMVQIWQAVPDTPEDVISTPAHASARTPRASRTSGHGTRWPSRKLPSSRDSLPTVPSSRRPADTHGQLKPT